MADLLVVEMRRDDAGDLPAAGQHGIGDDAHEADSAAAIDQLDA